MSVKFKLCFSLLLVGTALAQDKIFDNDDSDPIFVSDSTVFSSDLDIDNQEAVGIFQDCLDSHTDTDDTGPNGAWLDVETGNIFYFIDLGKSILVGLESPSIDENGLATFTRVALTTATFKGEEAAPLSTANAIVAPPVVPTLECVRIDNNTLFCMLVIGDNIRVFIFCREDGKWRCCQQDHIHVTS